ncbi:MAG: TAT-variant-translocated molybdopterin oxidoreductase, partial [Terracidiphilus sp.]
MNDNTKTTGAEVGETTRSVEAKKTGSVTGHDFSRAAIDPRLTRALAPAGSDSSGATRNASSAPMTLVQVRQQLQGVKGKRYWRSVDELADTAEFQAAVEREFPSSAQEWVDPVSRRGFMKLMGASLALAGLA